MADFKTKSRTQSAAEAQKATQARAEGGWKKSCKQNTSKRVYGARARKTGFISDAPACQRADTYVMRLAFR